MENGLKYISAVSVYNYTEDKLSTVMVRSPTEDWKFLLHSHPEFKSEVNLDWLSNDYKTAVKQLEQNELAVDIVTVKL